MASNRGLIALVLLVCAPQVATAGMEFGGAYVEVRSYSGRTPDEPISLDQRQVEALPYVDSALTVAAATVGSVDYAMESASGGGTFRWDFTQLLDGASGSYTVAEGELSFQVTTATTFTLLGDYAISGHGTKFAAFQLFDAPIDGVPVFEWRNLDNSESPASFDLDGAGELIPGKEYRFTYRLMLDNPTAGDAGLAASSVVFTVVGDGSVETQPGDANGDGKVDLTDLNLVRNNFGATGEGVPGDTPPFDQKVDLGDLNAVRNHFGESLPNPVPEPATWGMALLGLLALSAMRLKYLPATATVGVYGVQR